MAKYTQRVTAAAARKRGSRYLSGSALSSGPSDRGADGRFKTAGPAVSAVVVVLTRQQRRHAERQAAKLGRSLESVAQEAWEEVQAGSGGGDHD
jgi:hypothetical protein